MYLCHFLYLFFIGIQSLVSYKLCTIWKCLMDKQYAYLRFSSVKQKFTSRCSARSDSTDSTPIIIVNGDHQHEIVLTTSKGHNGIVRVSGFQLHGIKVKNGNSVFAHWKPNVMGRIRRFRRIVERLKFQYKHWSNWMLILTIV